MARPSLSGNPPSLRLSAPFASLSLRSPVTPSDQLQVAVDVVCDPGSTDALRKEALAKIRKLADKMDEGSMIRAQGLVDALVIGLRSWKTEVEFLYAIYVVQHLVKKDETAAVVLQNEEVLGLIAGVLKPSLALPYSDSAKLAVGRCLSTLETLSSEHEMSGGMLIRADVIECIEAALSYPFMPEAECALRIYHGILKITAGEIGSSKSQGVATEAAVRAVKKLAQSPKASKTVGPLCDSVLELLEVRVRLGSSV